VTDHELRVKTLWEKMKEKSLKSSKLEPLKWKRSVDLSWMRGARSRTLGTKYSGGK
jgi:hypothetical protein